MAESTIIASLRNKAAEIENAIASYQREIEKCRQTLAALQTTAAVFIGDGEHCDKPKVVSSFFARRETFDVICSALASAPDGLSTQELTTVCLVDRGMNTKDQVVRQSMRRTLIALLSRKAKHRKLVKAGVKDRCAVWKLPSGII